MMFQGKYAEASQFVVDLSHLEGYGRKRATDPFIPAFQLNVVGDSTNVIDYARIVDFTSGEIEVKWKNEKGVFSRKLFISRHDNVIVMKLTSNDNTPISNTFSLTRILNADENRLKKFELDENLGISKVESNASSKGLTFRAWYEKAYKNGYAGYNSYEGYEGAVKIIQSGGEVKIQNDKFIVNGASEIILLSKIEPSKNMERSNLDDLFGQLETFEADYDKIFEKHQIVHNDLFSRVTLDLDATTNSRQILRN